MVFNNNYKIITQFVLSESFLNYNHITIMLQELFDLKKEIAFNLSLLYRESGNFNMANLIMNKYLVI